MSSAFAREKWSNVPTAGARASERCASCGAALCPLCLWREGGESWCQAHVPLPNRFKGDLPDRPKVAGAPGGARFEGGHRHV